MTKKNQGEGRRVQWEGGREDKGNKGRAGLGEGSEGVNQTKEGASQTVQRYRGHGLLAGVHLRTHKIRSTQNGRENLLSSMAPETPSPKSMLTRGLWGWASGGLGHCQPCALAWSCCPWASPGGCFLCFADGGPHPLF